MSPEAQELLDAMAPAEEPAKALAPLPILVGIDEAERERRALDWFDRNLGPGDERALDDLLLIATGRVSTEGLDRNGNPVTKRPTYGDRIAAWDLLMTRHRGRPVSKVEIKGQLSVADKWDPDSLTLEEIRELKKLADKATTPVVDAEFTEDKTDG